MTCVCIIPWLFTCKHQRRCRGQMWSTDVHNSPSGSSLLMTHAASWGKPPLPLGLPPSLPTSHRLVARHCMQIRNGHLASGGWPTPCLVDQYLGALVCSLLQLPLGKLCRVWFVWATTIKAAGLSFQRLALEQPPYIYLVVQDLLKGTILLFCLL